MSISCHHCHKALDIAAGTRLARSAECPHCLRDLHSCKMCGFYDKSAYNECTEPVAERVLDKEKANFCDYFKLTGNRKIGEDNKQSLLDAADALFKD